MQQREAQRPHTAMPYPHNFYILLSCLHILSSTPLNSWYKILITALLQLFSRTSLQLTGSQLSLQTDDVSFHETPKFLSCYPYFHSVYPLYHSDNPSQMCMVLVNSSLPFWLQSPVFTVILPPPLTGLVMKLGGLTKPLTTPNSTSLCWTQIQATFPSVQTKSGWIFHFHIS